MPRKESPRPKIHWGRSEYRHFEPRQRRWQYTESIVRAAIKVKATGKIFTLPRPARHCDVLKSIAKPENKEHFAPPSEMIYGFLTCEGRFVDRVEGKGIAESAGQVSHAGAELTTGDLW